MALIVASPEGSPSPPRYVRTPAWQFLSSLPVDRRLYRHDIAGSIAHVEMLGDVGVLGSDEAGSLVGGLRALCAEIEAGHFPWRDDLEDIHTNIEVRLTEQLGPVGAKVHTGRSRNDQVALDERLYLREAVAEVQRGMLELQLALVAAAEGHRDTVMPGYTHLQRAQPVSLAHHLLAHFWRLGRDFDRLTDCFHRANVSPLGAGALAGSSLPIDPAQVARRLGFDATFDNSLDAVSDRDYFAELTFDLSLLAAHLSSIGEELVLWSTTEFGFVGPSEALGSGSSLMPHKRNPDVAELARAKAARVMGSLVSLLAMLKSLPLAYNRDLQEDKAAVFSAVDETLGVIEALSAVVPALRFDTERMAAAARDPRMLAADLAEYLVARGVAFREAHETVASYLEVSRGAIDAQSLREFSPWFGADVAGVLDPSVALARRGTAGGPSPDAVAKQLARARDVLGLETYTLSKHAERADVIDAILRAEPA